MEDKEKKVYPFKVGQLFEYERELYVVKKGGCKSCDFRYDKFGCESPKDKRFTCCAFHRPDNISVKFKKICNLKDVIKIKTTIGFK